MKTTLTETTALDAFDSILRFSRFFGTTTLRKNLQNSTTLTLFTVIVTAMNIAQLSLSLAQCCDESYADGNFHHFTNEPIASILISAASVAHRLLAIFKMRKRMPSTIRFLCDVDDLLRYPKSKRRIESRIAKWITAVVLLTNVSMRILGDSDPISVGVRAMDAYNDCAAVCVEFQFLWLCYFTARRCKLVNYKIATLGKKTSAQPNEEILVDPATVLSHKKRNPVKNEVEILTRTYRKCTTFCENLNERFAPTLLLSLMACTSNAFINSYYATRKGAIVEVALHSIGAVYYFGRFSCLCLAADSLSKEADKIKICIARCMNDKAMDCVTEELSILLDFAKVRVVKFTACGFFTMDMKLITAAIATGTTYLVVLVQFRKQ